MKFQRDWLLLFQHELSAHFLSKNRAKIIQIEITLTEVGSFGGINATQSLMGNFKDLNGHLTGDGRSQKYFVKSSVLAV